ncbi:MAG: restriction endonuclease subunit S [Candidatus Poribacteria bacterium]|nr:restriction endonuclease subunit S [Candidatus Poribacteria bacterium]
MSTVDFPKHWKIVKFGQVSDFQGGTQPPKSTFVSSPTHNYTRLLQIRDFESDDYVTYVSTKYNLRHVGESDVLIARYGASVGKVFRGKEGAINVALMKTIPNEKLIRRSFLFYFLQSTMVQSYLKGLGGRSAQAGFNRAEIGRIDFPLPPLPEQRAIAHVLQTIQEAKAARQREIELERERKVALMDYLFSRGTKGEPRKQTEIGEIPESWEVVRLGDYCHKPDYGYTESANNSPVGPKFLRITDIQNDNVNWDEVPYCVCSGDDREKYSLENGDIVIARIGATTGKAYMINDYPESVFASYLIRVRTKDDLLPPFLNQYFRTIYYWRQINQSKGGRLKGGVNIPILSRIVLPLPPFSEQQEIAEILHACDTKIAALEQEAARLDELFRAMLEELMTGRRSAVPLIDSELP